MAFNVPQVMSCLTAFGPSCDGVGEGTEGTSESTLPVGDLGLSKAIVSHSHNRKSVTAYMEYLQSQRQCDCEWD